ncbi:MULTISPECIES: RHS repeat-associated core domain-containing protein [unclassified Pseudomonas]|uniref:RHS repeat-associated core domain-containing protein n=1 Tax=unclassified Pseudomonas TaxID=196821 RepID=UPI000D8B0D28|nr:MULTISPECIES: RHS repeat-associated core domain-containing protein [unclassified Pseudomonas]PYG77034.1 RHS repeat-associated protein [Pseudomonas sp. RV120224-01c]PYG80655.1 RHS repeat-associated protein [Pseudomonas sp. RV120224-01b]
MATHLLATDLQRSVLPGLHAYSPYGFMKTRPAPALAFAGQHRDPLTGNYPLGNGRRFYSPTLMRFTTCDSLSPFSRGGINGYVYCGGDPVNRHDPSGAFWGAILRGVGLFSSGATFSGAVVRTMKNVVGHRKAKAANSGTNPSPAPHQDLPTLPRVSNQQFSMTGAFGVAGQVVAAVNGVTPGVQNAVDLLALGNTVTNFSGGLTGNFAAGREVVSYLWTNPREVPGVLGETFMDLTMLDEMLSTVGRGFTYVCRGFATAANWIRSLRSAPYTVKV